jgi:hypothetical protein
LRSGHLHSPVPRSSLPSRSSLLSSLIFISHWTPPGGE